MIYLIQVSQEDESAKRLLHSWYKPGPKQRKLPDGVLVEKLSPTMLAFSGDSLEGLQLIAYNMLRTPGRFRLFKAEEISVWGLQSRILELDSGLKEISEVPLDTQPRG